MKLALSFITLLVLAGCGRGINIPEKVPDLNKTTSEENYSESYDSNFTAYDNPYYKYQWSLHNTHALQWVNENASANVEEAWKKGATGKGVVVAIIDFSFDTEHEDLKDNILYTYNAGDKSSDVQALEGEETHGTSVYGIIGAEKNNKGIVGVAYDSKFILIKIGHTTEDLIDAFHFAENHGAQVISNSWGSYHMTDITYDLIEEAYTKNIKVVFSAGNNNENLDDTSITDECEHPHVICVGASNEKNEKTSYSNFGSAVDIVAPAGRYGVITTDASGTAGYNFDQLDTLKNLNYTYFTGTSASAPLVSGIVALMLQNEPDLTLEEILQRFRYSSDKIGDKPYTNGRNDFYGYGKINAGNLIN